MAPLAIPANETPAQRYQRIRIEASRETVESIIVAVVLALLFRAFVAEAFVIPTGSMAPALMGAHKDLVCPECNSPYQVGASLEQRASRELQSVVGSVCPNCRHTNALELATNANHATFTGDRILVSKFVYALTDPRRWDVIVFKYPGNPKQNYIKRLVGLPEETLRIRFGDVFSRPRTADQFTILRKPHDKLMAMSQTVHDTEYQARQLVQAGFPDRWQPWAVSATTPPTDSWTVKRDAGAWAAQLSEPGDEFKWLRYFHHWATDKEWEQAAAGISLAGVNPYRSKAITDFYAYDAYLHTDSSDIYSRSPGVLPERPGLFTKLLRPFRGVPGEFRPSYIAGDEYLQERITAMGANEKTGNHWVGDLIVEADVETEAGQGELVLELIESALTFRCVIDLSTGTARLEMIDWDGPKTFAEAGGTATSAPSADTGVEAGERHQIRFANCDDRLYLWVDGDPIEFDAAPDFDMSALRALEEQRPYTTAEHPFDAAPIAIGARGVGATVHRMTVLRDKYYIATQASAGGTIDDYDRRKLSAAAMSNLTDALTEPSLWDDLTAWEARRTVEFDMDTDQFFPMGDNSPESLDARCWVDGGPARYRGARNVDQDAYRFADVNYVPRDLLVGKALMVFWPHTWNSPVPLTPNLKQIRFIR